MEASKIKDGNIQQFEKKAMLLDHIPTKIRDTGTLQNKVSSKFVILPKSVVEMDCITKLPL